MNQSFSEMELWQAYAAHQVALVAGAKGLEPEKWLASLTDSMMKLVNMVGDYKRGTIILMDNEPCYTLSFDPGSGVRPPSRPAILVSSGLLGRGRQERWFTLKPRSH